jgi:hypothetical protein
MDRYEYVTQRRSETGKRMYNTSRYPVLELSEEDIYIYSKAGMRLDNLAFKYYGDSGLWWIIALGNNIGKGTFVVPLQMQIRIPQGPQINDLTGELNDWQNNV